MPNSRKKKETITISPDELTALRQSIEGRDFSPREREIILALIDECLDRRNARKARQEALARLRRMFDHGSEKRPGPEKKNEEPSSEPPPNHGRLGADAYPGAETINHPHAELKVGQICPECAHGTLQELAPGKAIRLVGNMPISAQVHQSQRFRCSGCGEIFSAGLPADLGTEKADASANAMVAMCRYGLGIPHYRLASIQEALGVPLPPSSQYEMVEMLWTQVAPVFDELFRQAANMALMFVDDTPAKILEFYKDKEARKAAGERVGVFTTAIVAQGNGREIRLFFTGRQHAGENLARLLDERDEALPPPIQMSDALSRNIPKNHLTIVALCLVHGRRNFIDSESAFPDEAAYVIQRIGTVYQNEREIDTLDLDDQKRLEYHQAHSRQPMEEIKAYAEAKMKSGEVEPNSLLGQAFDYLLKYWPGLTRFLEVSGAPLDNNNAERLIKRFILVRKNSLFYKTESGARVGDCLMSLIQTCQAAEENAVDYLTVLQRNSRHVAKNPHLWLPWNYRSMLRSVGGEAMVAETPPQEMTATG